MAETHTFIYPNTYALACGTDLPGFELCYTIDGWEEGKLKPVLWICHAFTGSAEVYDWWDSLIGPGAFFDPASYVIICANMLGSCYGSTGPLSVCPQTGKPWFHDFPVLTNRDIVGAFELLRQHLGIAKIDILMGGSMGGQQVLEWAIMYPEAIEKIIPIATNAFHSPWGIAFNETQRMAIEADASWEKNQEDSGMQGMKAARAVAMLSYRTYEGYNLRQSESNHDKIDDYRASSYQRYMGEKLSNRFNAYTYWYLSKAMDNHHIGRGRGDAIQALESILAQALVVALEGDLLFPPEEQRFIADHIAHAQFVAIPSTFGHDGFLVESEALAHACQRFLASKVY
ncbi:MAG: homoserine O-acetyltransferase [Bacteroidota bacterium]